MDKKERIVYGIIVSIIGGIIVAIIAHIASPLIPIAHGVVIMLAKILSAPIDTFWLVLSTLLFLLILAIIAKKVWIDLPKRYTLKSRLEVKTKQYDKLLEQVKLSRSIKNSISVEKWGKPIIQTGYEEFPHLNFDMRVINRTYLRLDPEEATIQCFCAGKQVCKHITWSKKVGTSDRETYIHINKLLKYDDDSINFHVPINEMYDDLSEWEIIGSVKYKLDEDIPQDLQLENGVELKIDLKYELFENKQTELRQKIENALANRE